MVESGHKVVMQRRMKQAGMRWADENLNPMLALRMALCNKRWAASWQAIRAHCQAVKQARRLPQKVEAPQSQLVSEADVENLKKLAHKIHRRSQKRHSWKGHRWIFPRTAVTQNLITPNHPRYSDNHLGFGYTNLMPLPSDFYALLAGLLHQMARTPDVPPVIPPKQWPIGSQEQLLLEEFQAALTVLQTRNQERQSQMEAHKREQSTLLEISQTLASALELKPGLILDQLRVIIEYKHAALFLLENLTLVALAVRGSQLLEQSMPFSIQLDKSETLAALFNGHQPQRIADVQNADPAAQFLWSLLNEQTKVLLEGVRAWMWVPLAVKGRIIGGIGVAHAEPDSFTAHHADLALIVANQAAITLVNAQLYEQAQTLATLEERQRLAQNLHDAVNQSLFSASLIAEVLPRLWERNPDEGRQSLEDLRRLTRGAMAEMRSLLAELRPLFLTDSDLGDLLRQLGDALTGRTNIPVTVTVTGQGNLPAEVQVTFYRLCQEGLNNIAKHAGASQVAIDLEYEGSKVELHIHDDGCGFNPANIPAGHYGLRIMRERAKAVGAELLVTSQPDQGTDILIRWFRPSKQETL